MIVTHSWGKALGQPAFIKPVLGAGSDSVGLRDEGRVLIFENFHLLSPFESHKG